MIWKIGIDSKEAKKAGKSFKDGSKQTGRAGDTAGRGAFAGGAIGALLGNLLSSVKLLLDPLTAVASLLVVALFPIFKPFLILFLKVGLLMFKWLNKILGTKSDAPGIIGTGKGGEDIIGEQGKELALKFGIIIGILAGVVAAVAGAPALFIAAIAIIFVFLGKKLIEFSILLGAKLADFIIWFGDKLKSFVGWLGEKWSLFVDWLSGTLNKIITLISEKWSDFLDLLSKSWEVLKDLGQWIFDSIIKILEISWDVLKDLGTWIFDTLKEILTTAFDAVKDLGGFIKSTVKSLLGFGGDSSTSVNDAIITPNGDIIRTNPADYLIATKDPSALGGGSRGASTINVTINGGLITDEVARDIGKVILREVNVGGGF